MKPRLRGAATLIRYADDLVIAFELHDDAERVMAVLGKRVGRYGLTLHPDKTRLLPFGRPSSTQPGRKGPATFDFLGFTFFWGKSRWGKWWVQCKTRCARLRRAIVSVAEWCRRHRHHSVEVQHAALTRRIRGHFNYFGVSGNGRLINDNYFCRSTTIRNAGFWVVPTGRSRLLGQEARWSRMPRLVC